MKGKEQIGKVVNDILKILVKELEEEDMKKFSEIINTNKEKLKEKTNSSDELKKVLGYVSKINLQGVRLGIESISQLLCRREDMSEESEPLVALAEPEGVHDGRHINHFARTDSTPHDRNHSEHHPHNRPQR